MIRSPLLFIGFGFLLGGFTVTHFFWSDHRELIVVRSKLEAVQHSNVAADLSLKEEPKIPSNTSVPEEQTDGEEILSFSPLAPGTKPKDPKFEEKIRNQYRWDNEEKLMLLVSRLRLSPSQEKYIKAILDAEAERLIQKSLRSRNGETPLSESETTSKSLEEELETLLSPEQKAAHTAMKKDQEKMRTESKIMKEMNQAHALLGLNEDQKDKVYSALYQADEEMRKSDWRKKYETPGTSYTLDRLSDAKLRNQVKLNAVAPVLTREQFEIYKKKLDMKVAQQEQILRNLPPPKIQTGTFQ